MQSIKEWRDAFSAFFEPFHTLPLDQYVNIGTLSPLLKISSPSTNTDLGLDFLHDRDDDDGDDDGDITAMVPRRR
jgi:hypothetical protein